MDVDEILNIFQVPNHTTFGESEYDVCVLLPIIFVVYY